MLSTPGHTEFFLLLFFGTCVCVFFFGGGGIKLVGVLRPVNRCGYIQAIHISYWRGVGGFLLLESPALHADADIVTLFPPAKQPSRHAPLERHCDTFPTSKATL